MGGHAQVADFNERARTDAERRAQLGKRLADLDQEIMDVKRVLSGRQCTALFLPFNTLLFAQSRMPRLCRAHTPIPVSEVVLWIAINQFPR